MILHSILLILLFSHLSGIKWSQTSHEIFFLLSFFCVHCNHAKQILLRDDIDNMNSNINSISNIFFFFTSSLQIPAIEACWSEVAEGELIKFRKAKKKFFFLTFFDYKVKILAIRILQILHNLLFGLFVDFQIAFAFLSISYRFPDSSLCFNSIQSISTTSIEKFT